MKNILLLFTCLIFTPVISQTEFKKFEVGVNFSPEYSYRFLTSNYELDKNRIANRNDWDKGNFGYSASVNFVYNFKSFVGLETGVSYLKMGYNRSLLGLVITKYDYDFISIPLKVNFTVGKGEIKFISSIGMHTSFLITEKFNTYENEHNDRRGFIYQTSEKPVVEGESPFNKIDIMPTISAGFLYQINPSMKLKVEPNYRISTFADKTSTINTRLWNAGLNIGFYYGF